ncbi:hypothetical protein RX910_07365 [Pseudomonas syringae pv. actinidiae]|nr:hypothetical protein [Pseudomonas syringae pv. actinidiae]MDU8058099.1 hypothetical protein [Pseudomonas syringae pv. actinidiae]MDU8110035.1 hypothetical protein [Pseudomonas syringae pv. actinidiae]MDU8239109.1 hypothetical protein [Pseudomonas syringae pv. actinidiae]MDU8249746.1 hypothetical protein [Pseudomonas syringae pv. actinidiae]
MKTTKLIFGLAFSVLASSAFALPAVNTVNNSDMSKAPLVAEGGTKHTNVGSIRVSADGADHVGANRLAADGADRVGANRQAADGADRVGANRLGDRPCNTPSPVYAGLLHLWLRLKHTLLWHPPPMHSTMFVTQ